MASSVLFFAAFFLLFYIFYYNKSKSLLFYSIAYISGLTDIIIVTFCFMTIILVSESFNQKRIQFENEKRMLQMEIAYLQQQMNPHFLFNTLNSIHILISSNAELATKLLMKFSSLLRYQIYMTKNKYVPLKSELNFIEEYVAVEKIRKETDLDLKLNIDGGENNLKITPLILHPFIENAFKHVAYNSRKSFFIQIKIYTSGSMLYMETNNSFTLKTIPKNSGIGIENTQKRIQLMYPLSHQLSITDNDGVFSVKLIIDSNEMYHS
jgi:LytS/YehU family sensor histidine kinase